MVKVNSTGQAAFEFLLTYGWMFVVLLLGVSTLLYSGLLDKNIFLENDCYFDQQFGDCDEFAGTFSSTDGIVQLKLTNMLRVPLNISSCSFDIVGYCSGDCFFNSVNVSNEDTQATWEAFRQSEIVLLCDEFIKESVIDATIFINYSMKQSQRKHLLRGHLIIKNLLHDENLQLPTIFQCSNVQFEGLATQILTLNQTKENLVSFYVQPYESNMQSIFQPLIDSGQLIKVIDENGNSLMKVMSTWVNNIGNMQLTEGYRVVVNETTSFEVLGSLLDSNICIDLVEGDNIISHPFITSTNALDAVQPLIDEGVLIEVLNEDGESINHTISWENNIGDMMPGEGYKVETSKQAVLLLNKP